jgi:DNA polymerase III sliding clamp (beta) subunit (PCNA family)/exonuclease VII small subunit
VWLALSYEENNNMKNTEIEIAVAELKNVLPGLAKIISRHTTLPVLGCVKLSLDAESHVISLQAHNLDEIATARLENQAAGNPGQLLVPFEMLNKIIKGCTAEQSVRFIGNKTETQIRYVVAGNSVDRLLDYIPVAEYPEVKVVEGEPITLDESFKTALKEAVTCASEDSSRYVLNGACLDVRDKVAHYVVGTDGRHLYSANSFHFKLPESLIIPTRKFLAWPGFVNDGVWKLRMLPVVKVDPNDQKADKSKDAPPWLRIDSDHWSYVARGIDGQYPNWKQVLPSDTNKWTQLILGEEALQMMQQAIPLLPGAESFNQTIVLEVADKSLSLHARGKDDQEDTRMVVPEVRIIGKPVVAALNRTYLLQALRFGLSDIRILDSLTPLVFSQAGKTMIVMPIRLEEPAPPVSPTVAENSSAPISTSPPENAPAAPPSPAGADNPTESERKDTMTTLVTPMTPPVRGNLKANGNGNGNATEENGSAIKSVIDQVEKIKASLRQAIGDLTDTVSLLKAAEKENKAASKEIQSVRQTLRSLKSVEI